MGAFNSFSISASGLTAERLRLDLISNNIANINTAGTPGGGPGAPAPYQAEVALFAQRLVQQMGPDGVPGYAPGGVEVTAVANDNTPPRLVYDPGNPLANKTTGYVAYPNINIVNQMVDMITAVRAYQANVTAFNATKEMAQKALSIGGS